MKNIEINIKQSDGTYESLYPKTNSETSIVSETVINNLGLNSNASVNDALEWFSKYNLYWWKRRIYNRTINIETGKLLYTQKDSVNSSSATNYLYVCTQDNTIITENFYIPVSTTQRNYAYDSYDNGDSQLSNCYFYPVDILHPENWDMTKMYFAPSGTFRMRHNYYSSDGDRYYNTYVENCELHTIKVEMGEWEYLCSSEKDKYPTKGIVDNYEYIYCDKPFLNSIYSDNIEIGTYVGTGTSEVEIITSKKPKGVFLNNSSGEIRNGSNLNGGFVIAGGLIFDYYTPTIYKGIEITDNGFKVFWISGSYRNSLTNKANVVYYYFVIY